MSNLAEFTHWSDQAACLSEDPELFFPVSGIGPSTLQAARAKAVCRRCTVRQQCLDYAIDTHQRHGIWGGLSDDERRALHSKLSRVS